VKVFGAIKLHGRPRASAEKFPGEGGEITKIKSEKAKKTKKSPIKFLPGRGVWRGGQRKKNENSYIKPLSTISVPCMKI